MRGVLISLFAAGGLLAGAPVLARQPNGLGADWSPLQGAQARSQVGAGRIVPLSTATDVVRRRIPGRLLDAALETDNGKQVYRVRWGAADGRRIDVIVDAASGQIVRQEGR